MDQDKVAAPSKEQVQESADEFDLRRRNWPVKALYDRAVEVSRARGVGTVYEEKGAAIGVDFKSLAEMIQTVSADIELDSLRTNFVVSEGAQPSKTYDDVDFLRSQMVRVGEPGTGISDARRDLSAFMDRLNPKSDHEPSLKDNMVLRDVSLSDRFAALATEEVLSKEQEDQRQAALWSVAAGMPERPSFIPPTAAEEDAHWRRQKDWEDHPELDQSDHDSMPDLEEPDDHFHFASMTDAELMCNRVIQRRLGVCADAEVRANSKTLLAEIESEILDRKLTAPPTPPPGTKTLEEFFDDVANAQENL